MLKQGRLTITTLIFLAAAFVAEEVQGQTQSQNSAKEIPLFASDGMANDYYGWSVSVSGSPGNEVAVVGAFLDDTATGTDAGSAYIYRYNGSTWVKEAHLLASDGEAGDLFGYSVSISGSSGSEVALVGAYHDDTENGKNSGSLYVYRLKETRWIEEAHLFATDGLADDYFGISVSINGNVAIAGAGGDDSAAGIRTGSAYVYRFNGTRWIEEANLYASDGAEKDWFGASVSISGVPGSEVAIVGVSGSDTTRGANVGSAYVYRCNGAKWEEEAHLFASDGSSGDTFGKSVSVSDDVAIIGASKEDTEGGKNAGSAYIFRFNGTNWIEEAHLVASDGAENDWFGWSVSISSDQKSESALVGAWTDDTAGGNRAGSAYVYRFNGKNWVEEDHLLASDGAADDYLGGSVSICGSVKILGAIWKINTEGSKTGAVYIFDSRQKQGDPSSEKK